MNSKLDALVASNQISSYVLQNVDSEGVIGAESDNRNSELLTLTFPNGLQLEIGCFVSGCAEDATLIIE